MLDKVAQGCKEELKRQRRLYDTPEKSAVDLQQEEDKRQWWMARGSDSGQKAASVLVQWATQEQELDNIVRMWEQAREFEQADRKEMVSWMENR